MACDTRIRLLVQERREGKMSAINLFLQHARYPIVVIINADVLPEEDCIERLVAPFADPIVGITGGRPVAINDRDTLPGFGAYLLWDMHHQVSLTTPKMGELIAYRNFSEIAISPDTVDDEGIIEELVARKGAHIRYTTIQNWSNNVYNLVTKRAHAHEDAVVEWVDGNIGSKLTMKYPAIVLKGERAHGEVLSIAFAGHGQHQDAGAKMTHVAPNTTSRIVSKSISKDDGRSSYRGLVKVGRGAHGCKTNVECDALLIGEKARSDTYPTMDVAEDDVRVEHEARVSKVAEEQLFYLQSRGLDEDKARMMIVNGFIEPFVKELPMEYAVELNRLIELEMEGSVG